MSVHKSAKSLKRDGILLMLFDLIILLTALKQNQGIIFTVSTLKTIILDFVIYNVINAWWAIDSKKWITDKRISRFIWSYVFFELVILLVINLLMLTGHPVEASVFVYMLVVYYIFGIQMILRYI